MNSIKPTQVIGCIFLVLFATQVIFSGSDYKKINNQYCEPIKRCNPYSSSGNCVDYKNEEICAMYLQDCGLEPAPPNNSHLPQYLVIGDSTARGMFPFLKTKLEDIAEPHIIPGTPETSKDGANCIKVWVGPNLDRWDVISFNFGLNDSTKITEHDYGPGVNMGKIITHLMQTKAGKHRKLILILTIPTSNTSCCNTTTNNSMHLVHLGPADKLPCPHTINSYNSLLYKVLQQFPTDSITVDDLYAHINLYCCHHSDCYFDSCDIYQSSPNSTCSTNFTCDGWENIATSVSTTVKQVLKQEY